LKADSLSLSSGEHITFHTFLTGLLETSLRTVGKRKRSTHATRHTPNAAQAMWHTHNVAHAQRGTRTTGQNKEGFPEGQIETGQIETS